jgi:CheY-like chemotaxis protein
MALKAIDNKLNILIVDDDLLNLLFLKIIIEGFGYACEAVNNGKLAIEKIRTMLFDLVLMDMQMPELNGLEAATIIRNELNSDIPIIATTAEDIKLNAEKYKMAGINDCIRKPIDEKILLKKILNCTIVSNKPFINYNFIEAQKNIYLSINLNFLRRHTNANAAQIVEIISAFLIQNPLLMNVIAKSVDDENWIVLQKALHKMIPSFTILGMNEIFFELVDQIQSKAIDQKKNKELIDLITTLQTECAKAYLELQAILIQINK